MGKLFRMFCNLWWWKSDEDAHLHQSGTTEWRKALYGLTFWVQKMQYTALPRYCWNAILIFYLTDYFLSEVGLSKSFWILAVLLRNELYRLFSRHFPLNNQIKEYSQKQSSGVALVYGADLNCINQTLHSFNG